MSRIGQVADTVRRRVDELARKVFPGHWSFLLGEVAMFAFVVLVLTGGYLAWFYEASGESVTYRGSYGALEGVEVSGAYASVIELTFDTPAGALVRQTHHWAAVVFVAAIVVHAMRVFFTGAFRRPRRLNWTIGVTMLGLAMVTGFFGLALPHDLLGGTGARIGHAFAVSIPFVGPGVAHLLFAGDFGNPDMLHRFWLLHVVILPLLLAGLLGGHLLLVFLQTHTQFGTGRRREDNVVGSAAWPGYLLRTTGLALVVGGVLLALGAVIQIAPIWLYGPFDPAAATVPAQPDWYLGWVEGSLRVLPSMETTLLGREVPSPFLTGLTLPVVLFVLLVAWPFLEALVTGDRATHHLLDRPREHPVRTGVGVAGLAFVAVLLAAGSHDLQALLVRVPVDSVTTVYRWLLVLVPPVAGLVTTSVCRSLVRTEREGLAGRRAPDAPDERHEARPIGARP